MSERTETIKKLIVEKQPAVNRLVLFLKKYNIIYVDSDGELENVIFSKENKTFKCAYESFFRYSGRCVYKTIDDEVKFMTDDMYYDWFKMFILFKLGVEKV